MTLTVGRCPILRIVLTTRAPERAAFAPKHSPVRRQIGIEGLECGNQRIGTCEVYRVAFLGTAVDYGPNGTRLLDADGTPRE